MAKFHTANDVAAEFFNDGWGCETSHFPGMNRYFKWLTQKQAWLIKRMPNYDERCVERGVVCQGEFGPGAQWRLRRMWNGAHQLQINIPTHADWTPNWEEVEDKEEINWGYGERILSQTTWD